jgi:VWFA-related protein
MTTYLRRGIVLLVARISAALVLPALGLAAIAAAAQNAPPSPAISVSTRLVQVGVVVRDKSGPVTDLTKDDFVVLDRGKPQSVSLFSVESGRSWDQPVRLLPQNTFSDLPQYGARATRSVTIVLLDNLNTLYGSAPRPYESRPSWFEDFALANAKAHLVEFLKQLDPRDRVAIYGLSDSLHVLSDFTSDRHELLEILQNYQASSKTNRGVVQPGAIHTPVPDGFNASVDQSNLSLASAANQRRRETTMAALEAIAAHVANIPGRKNLVWLTANLPFSGTAMARILNPAQIAAYPVDGRGLLTRDSPGGLEGTMDADALARGNFMPAQSPQPVGIDTMQEMAEETGGQAFVNTNDLTGAIRTAVEGSGVTYTLGFYLNPNSADGKFHVLKIQVKRSGLRIRYPKGYFAFQDEPATKDQNYRSLVTALGSPVESSLIPVEIKIVRVEQPLPHGLSLFASVDIHNLRLLESDGRRKGALEIVTVEQDETGRVVRKSAHRINLDFTPEQYATYLQAGFTFHQFLQPQEGVTTLRLVVEDPRTAEVGSLIIPLSQLK